MDVIVADLLIEYRVAAQRVDAIGMAECPGFPGFMALGMLCRERELGSIAATKPTARAIGRCIARQQLKALKASKDIELSEER